MAGYDLPSSPLVDAICTAGFITAQITMAACIWCPVVAAPAGLCVLAGQSLGWLGMACVFCSPTHALAMNAIATGTNLTTGRHVALALLAGTHLPRPLCEVLSVAAVWDLAPAECGTMLIV